MTHLFNLLLELFVVLFVVLLDLFLELFDLEIDILLFLKKLLLLVNCNQQVRALRAICFLHILGNQIEVLGYDFGTLTVVGLLGHRVDVCEGLRYDGDQKIHHDYHVEECTKYEQDPHVSDSNCTKTFLVC